MFDAEIPRSRTLCMARLQDGRACCLPATCFRADLAAWVCPEHLLEGPSTLELEGRRYSILGAPAVLRRGSLEIVQG